MPKNRAARLHSAETLYRGQSLMEKGADVKAEPVKIEPKSLAERIEDWPIKHAQL